MKVSHSKLIENQHLNENAILLATDAMLLDKVDKLPKSIQTHLEECSECRNKVFDYYQFRINDDIQEILPHPYFDDNKVEKVKERKLTKSWAVAASVIMLLGLTFMLYKFLEPIPEENISKQTDNVTQPESFEKDIEKKDNNLVETKKQITPQKQDVFEHRGNNVKSSEKEGNVASDENNNSYETLAYFEEQISHSLKNPVRNNYLKVLTPNIDSRQSQSITFEFDKKSSLSLELEIFTTKDKNKPLIFEIEKNTQSFNIPQNLEANLYYWQLKRVNQGRKTRIGLGKFIVENK